jgi:hypothetical protein
MLLAGFGLLGLRVFAGNATRRNRLRQWQRAPSASSQMVSASASWKFSADAGHFFEEEVAVNVPNCDETG